MAVVTAAPLGPRQAAVLEHLEEHPGLTAGELARALGLNAEPYRLLRRLESRARVVAVAALEPSQGRMVTRWRVAPPGTVPPPPPVPDPDAARRRERDRRSQRARRARARGLHVQPGMEAPSLRSVIVAAPDLPGAACRDAVPGLFFPAEDETAAARYGRQAKAIAICAGCPVRAGCYAAALANREPWGIWGGVDFEDVPSGRRRAS